MINHGVGRIATVERFGDRSSFELQPFVHSESKRWSPHHFAVAYLPYCFCGNLFLCFTFPLTKHAVSCETKSPLRPPSRTFTHSSMKNVPAIVLTNRSRRTVANVLTLVRKFTNPFYLVLFQPLRRQLDLHQVSMTFVVANFLRYIFMLLFNSMGYTPC